jgi:aspartyl-tRNA(Asn)/glutamyl-tRNA(Gln) amidotransferase subunit A
VRTVRQTALDVQSGDASALSVLEESLAAIRARNDDLNVFLYVDEEGARAAASAVDERVARGENVGALAGVPVALKDNLCQTDIPTTCSSKILEGWRPPYNATVVDRLLLAGAVPVGKTNLDEFAMGSSTENSAFGPTKNPLDTTRVPGGSSGGSAAAVAMDHCYAALGTDTGGSIRTPSAMCGVTGFKATYGRVSIRGIVPLTWSLDHCGPIARTVEDTATMLQIIAGYDRLDLQSVDYSVPDYIGAIGAPVAQFRLGVSPQFYDGLDPGVADAVEAATAVLVKMTKGAKEIEMPSILGTGANSEGGVYREELGNGFVRAETESAGGGGVGGGGGFGGSSRAVDYIKEWRALRLVRRTVDIEVFRKQEVDLIVTPTIREVAWSIEDELTRAANARARNPKPGNTRALDDYGLPTITVPCGFSKSGMPIGLQISGANWREQDVLALAHAYQKATDWHTRRPTLTADAKVPTLSKAAAGQTGEAVGR